jgi:hypothetical protein
LHTLHRAIPSPRKLAKTNVQTTLCDQRKPANASSLYLAFLIGRAKSTHSCAFLRLLAQQASLLPSINNAQTSPQPRPRRAFTRRGPCVPSRSALGPSHALHPVRKQGCPSSLALSSPKDGSRQEIADIPCFAASPWDAHRARGSLIFAPLQHAGRQPSVNSSSSAQQLPRRLQPQPLRDLGAETDMEVGLADPHPMQNACQLARHRDDRAQRARPFGHPQAPCPQCRPFPHSQQQARGRFAQRLADGDVALLTDRPS